MSTTTGDYVSFTTKTTISSADMNANLNRTPGWQKYTFSYTDFQTAAASAGPVLFLADTLTTIHNILRKPTVAFSGGGITAVENAIGDSATSDRYGGYYDVAQAVTSTAFLWSDVGDITDLTTTKSIIVTMTAAGANLDSLAAGSLDLYVLKSVLPA